jgi:hypothetical protein
MAELEEGVRGLLTSRLTLIRKASELTAELLKIQLAFARVEFDVVRCEMALERDSSDAAMSQELLVSLDQREALALEGAILQATLDAIEADIFEIDQKITAPEREERDT